MNEITGRDILNGISIDDPRLDDETRDALKQLKDAKEKVISKMQPELQRIIDSDAVKAMQRAMVQACKIQQGFYNMLRKEYGLEPEDFWGAVDDLKPDVPELMSMPIEDFPFESVIAKAREKKMERLAVKVSVRPSKDLPFPLDKVNKTAWNFRTESEGGNGRTEISLGEIKGKLKGTEVKAIYGINFDELPSNVTISRKLTMFDKRVYCATGALWDAGNKVFSLAQIYKAMGNRKKPNSNDLQKCKDAIVKMSGARILIDNTDEAEKLKDRKRILYMDYLLPAKFVMAEIDGKVTDGAVNLYARPPLIEFGDVRGQITKIPRNVLESPLSKTENNLRIDDYLLERIGHMKRDKGAKGKARFQKILWETLFCACDITDRTSRYRAKATVTEYLKHYKEVGWIADFKTLEDGIQIKP